MANVTSAFSEPFSNKIKFDRKIVLGIGNSVVYQGTYKGQKVAVKRVLLDQSITEVGDNLKAQKELAHVNVLKIFAIEEDPDFRYLVLEFCSGSLLRVIENPDDHGLLLPSDEDVTYQIANGIAYIHSQNLVHFDIKPENILISMNGKIKLSEFGLRKPKEEKCFLTGLKGILLWMAPECFPCNRDETNKKRNPKSDVFSCGCVFFVFLTRAYGRIHPFGDTIDHLQIHINIREDKPINFNRLKHDSISEVIQKMVQHDLINRITSNDVKDLLLKISNDKQKYNSTQKKQFPLKRLLDERGTRYPDGKYASQLGPYAGHQGEVRSLVRSSMTQQLKIIATPAEQTALSDPSSNPNNNFSKLIEFSNYQDYHPRSNFLSKTRRLSEGIVNAMGQGESEVRLNCSEQRSGDTSPLDPNKC